MFKDGIVFYLAIWKVIKQGSITFNIYIFLTNVSALTDKIPKDFHRVYFKVIYILSRLLT